MKHYNALFLSFLLLIITSCTVKNRTANAEKSSQKVLENTLLWEISGNGLAKPSYMFGTYHMMCKNDFEIKEKVKNALSKTDQTVLEINMGDTKQMMEAQKFLISNQKLSQQYTADEVVKLEKGLQKFGYQLKDVEQFSPLALYSMLTMKFFDCPPNELKMLDLEIMKLTNGAGKKVLGLETIKDQALMFNEFLSPKDLLKMVENYDKNKTQGQALLKDYLAENLQNVENHLLNSDDMSPEQKKILLDNRNLNWQQQMPALMKDNPTFFAVGAAHLVGEKGMIKLLRDLGYTVKPLF